MRDFEAIKIKSSDGKWLNSSISVGVVHILPNEDFNSAWKRASKKLLLAKSKGSAQLSFS
ncbi:hypothetical protein A3729_28775 [Oleiphilus sp. HI0043]|nr:hypothetical protein A3729_28775 [Oleiphilus sp. HI0043]